MVRKFAILMMLIFVVSLISAVDNDLFVKVGPEYDGISISVLRTEAVYSLIESFHKPLENGEIRVTFSTNEDEVDVKIWLKSNDETLFLERYGPYEIGNEIVIDLVGEEEINETVDNADLENNAEFLDGVEDLSSVVVEGSEDENGAEITGNSILDSVSEWGPLTYVLITIILLVGFLVMFFFAKGRKNVQKKGFEEDSFFSAEEKMKRAANEYAEAKRELAKLKEKDSELFEAEEELEKARERFEKLKRSKGEVRKG